MNSPSIPDYDRFYKMVAVTPKKLIDRDDPVLTSVSEMIPVELLKPGSFTLGRLVKILKEHLRKAGHGVGMALPQLGIPLRGFHMASHISMPNRKRFCFNPEIEARSSETTTENEGCLSLGGGKESYAVTRPVRIQVAYTNDQGQRVHEILTGLAARCFQHEFDHLNGVLISSSGTPTQPRSRREGSKSIPPALIPMLAMAWDHRLYENAAKEETSDAAQPTP